MGIEPTRHAVPDLKNKRFGAMANPNLLFSIFGFCRRMYQHPDYRIVLVIDH
jgi:hypothetical protein